MEWKEEGGIYREGERKVRGRWEEAGASREQKRSSQKPLEKMASLPSFHPSSLGQKASRKIPQKGPYSLVRSSLCAPFLGSWAGYGKGPLEFLGCPQLSSDVII
ncbi:hypothetical protein Taro_009548, partial [Colocasia esculenta]|nr:hypothetical protein [Colocasia esculenta]